MPWANLSHGAPLPSPQGLGDLWELGDTLLFPHLSPVFQTGLRPQLVKKLLSGESKEQEREGSGQVRESFLSCSSGSEQ